ncbi:hypothetical protein [Saccharospirillum mangrovi]|uniref:hypothetical protein n=1 Tax=Saccharospirillum mangrovi TaxID=2161747 RepID=UPI000D37B639|nr:hypothetical protein [Saccharospirillum mangrovi]
MGIDIKVLLSIAAVVMVVVMLVAMVITQSRHRHQAAVREQLQNLNTQYRKLNNVLRSLPEGYLSSELRDFIYQALLQNIRAQVKLKPDQEKYLISDYEQLTTERAHAKQHPPKASIPNLKPEEINLHRHTLKALFLFIKRNYETGHMDKPAAEKMMRQVEIKLVETAVRFFTGHGEQCLQSQNYQEACRAFQKGLDSITASRHASEFKQEELALRNQLGMAKQQWQDHRQEMSSSQAEKLAEGMESLVEDQDSWKKKNVYD